MRLGGPLRLKGFLWFTVALAAVANVAILLVDDFLWQFAFGLILLCLLPGFMLVRILFSPSELPDLLERIVLSGGAGYCFLILVALGIHYLPGSITPHLALLVYDALIVLLSIFCLRRTGGKSISPSKNVIFQIFLLLAIASFFRFTHLGYSEFQGDEARAILRAAEIIRGWDDVLFLHKKGPVEILIPAIFYSLSSRTNEFVARFPFALANLVGLIAIYLLGRRMFNERVGFAAALLLAIEGYMVAFSRIVQYQSVVFLMTALSIFCFYRFFRLEEGGYKYLVLGSLFAGVGLLAHYEAIFALPVGAYLILRKARRAREWVRLAVSSLAVFAFVALSFYLPFLIHPHFRETLSYIAESRVGGGIPYNNLPDFFVRSTFYNSTYYIVFLILLMVAAAIKMLVSRRASMELKTLLLWFTVPFILYFFLMRKVHTHYYLIFAPWILIGGTVIDGWRQSIQGMVKRRKALLGIPSALAVALILVFAYYTYMVFVQHNPEYKRTYPEHKNRFYWTVYSEIPGGGYFGFPYRAGWKVIGYLYDKGILAGDYDSNEESLITTWYTRGELRCPNNPEYYFVAKNVQDVQEIPIALIKEKYNLAGTILVEGEPKLWIYQHSPLASLKDYDLEQYAHTFDSHVASLEFHLEPPLDESPHLVFQHPLEVNLGDKIRLLGFDLDRESVEPGGILFLTLYWQAITEMDADYHVFVHLGYEYLWAQEDRGPTCDSHPTYRWEPREIIIDRYSIPVDSGAPPGQYPLQVGMYDALAGCKRLRVLDEAGECLGDSIFLTNCLIKGQKFSIPEIQHPMHVNLGDKVLFLGYDLGFEEVKPGGTLALTLYWQAQEEMEVSYKVFTHLVDKDGQIWGQMDSIPRNGVHPTTGWLKGEVVIDEYGIPVKSDAPLGEYVIAIGMYDPRTGERLIALDEEGNRLPDNRIIVDSKVQVVK